MNKDTLSLQLPVGLLSKSKVTMRALLEREVAQQESYIKETLKAIEIPFKSSLHPKIDRRKTVFSIKMKPYFSEDDFEKDFSFGRSLLRDNEAERLLREAKYLIEGIKITNKESFVYHFQPSFRSFFENQNTTP